MDQKQQHAALKTYLLSRFHVGDWHGVSDAANDLRVLEAQMARPSGDVLTRAEFDAAFRTAQTSFDLAPVFRGVAQNIVGGDDFAEQLADKIAEELGL